MSRPISRGVSIKRFNTHPTLRFSFFFCSPLLEGRKMDIYDNVSAPTISKRVGIGKCTFRSHFHPRCIFSRNAEFPLDIYQPGSRYLLYRKECRVTLIRRGGYAVPPFRECDDTANSERIFRYPRLYKIL